MKISTFFNNTIHFCATETAFRLSSSEADIFSIPVQPISYSDAEHFLRWIFSSAYFNQYFKWLKTFDLLWDTHQIVKLLYTEVYQLAGKTLLVMYWCVHEKIKIHTFLYGCTCYCSASVSVATAWVYLDSAKYAFNSAAFE